MVVRERVGLTEMPVLVQELVLEELPELFIIQACLVVAAAAAVDLVLLVVLVVLIHSDIVDQEQVVRLERVLQVMEVSLGLQQEHVTVL